MSAKIKYANDDIRKRIERRSPEDKNVYINFDAIAELPDEFEAVVSEVLFDPKHLEDSFSAITKDKSQWMAQPKLMYEIADACGISGIGKPISEPIIEEIDINPMLCKPLGDAPTMRKMTIGRRVVKQSSVMQEDGTPRHSSLCTCEYNVWERCCTMWSSEEKWTDGYSKKSLYDNKYDTKWRRKAHFDEEMKFAHAKAESKANLKSIRELGKMDTGYKTEDLKEGKLYFVKIRRSAMVLHLETAARLENIRTGGTQHLEAGKQLFGLEAPGIEVSDNASGTISGNAEDITQQATPEPEQPPKTQLTEAQAMSKHLAYWQEQKLIPKDFINACPKLIAFFDQPSPESNVTKMADAKKHYASIEKSIPSEYREPKEEQFDLF